MKASELRIGNWVRTNKEEKVVDVMCDSINTHDKEGLPYDHIYPIPLTKEWLMNFGFGIGFDWDNGYFLFKEYAFKDGVLYKQGRITGSRCIVSSLKIEYVHQLQNLYFALTGEELEPTH